MLLYTEGVEHAPMWSPGQCGTWTYFALEINSKSLKRKKCRLLLFQPFPMTTGLWSSRVRVGGEGLWNLKCRLLLSISCGAGPCRQQSRLQQ